MNQADEIKLKLICSQLADGHEVKVKAGGHSMKPLIKMGDLLQLQSAEKANYRQGEIIAFLKNDQLFIHRLLKIFPGNDLIMTKGDNLAYSDALIEASCVIGRVIMVNGKRYVPDDGLKSLCFNIYCGLLFARNSGNQIHDGNITRVYLSNRRFRISKRLLSLFNKVCGF